MRGLVVGRCVAGVVLAVVLAGCGTDVELPEPLTVAKISDTLRHQVDLVQEHCRTGTVSGADLAALNSSVVFLHGHLQGTGRATDAQLDTLEEVHRQLVRIRQGAGRDPEAEDTGFRPDPKLIEKLLADLRTVLAGLPDDMLAE